MDTHEALRRVHLILPMLIADVRTAIHSHAVMEAMNDIVPIETKGLRSPLVATYGAVHTALVLKFAMDLARIFDLSEPTHRPAHKQRQASIQVLAALLSIDDVGAALEDEAANWFPGVSHVGTVGSAPPGIVEAALEDLENEHRKQGRIDCRKAVDEFLAVAGRLDVEGSDEKAAFERVREFRTRRLAHSLFDKSPDELPRYGDLHLLLGISVEAVTAAALAIDGLNTSLDERAALDRENAEGFARCLVDGLKLAVVP